MIKNYGIDLQAEIGKYNENSIHRMTIEEVSEEYFYLCVNGRKITEGDEYDILKRVRQINRENGYNFL